MSSLWRYACSNERCQSQVSLQARVAKITLFRACFLTVAILCSRVLTRKQRELKIFAMWLNVELADVTDNLQYKIIDPQSNNRRLCSGSSACVWITWSFLIVSRRVVRLASVWTFDCCNQLSSKPPLTKTRLSSKLTEPGTTTHLIWVA